ncbi:MAG: hypothetical protein ACRDGR_11220 [bacterium]
MTRAALVLLGAFLGGAGAAADAQAVGYRALLDTQFESVAFRGLVIDSIRADDVVTGPDGGLTTPDGIAVHCVPGFEYCTFYRPGPEQQNRPWVTTGSVSLWGLGAPGLSFRSIARVATDVGGAGVWPGTDPALQLLEAVAEWARPSVVVRAGRMHEVTRFGAAGFDGGHGEVRLLQQRARAFVYGGWGLAEGVALPVTHEALNPLDQIQPKDREHVLGLGAAWTSVAFDARAIYQREVHPPSDNFLTERIGAEAGVRLPLAISLSAGSDWDLLRGVWGSAEARLAARGAAVGVRRYRPRFDLWTIWDAFSPVPYRAGYAEVSLAPVRNVEVHGRGELYEFEDAEAATPLVAEEDGGWRWSAGGTWRAAPAWSVGAGLHQEYGPGASSLGYQARVSVDPARGLTVAALGSWLDRPLEFRYSDAEVLSFGLEADWRPSPRLRFSAKLRRFDEERNRPDAAAFEWDQLRVGLGATFLFDSAPGLSIPPAVWRIPERGGGA